MAPSIAVLPDVLKSSLRMANILPAAFPALAELVLGPGGEVNVPLAIDDSGKVGNNGSDGVDASEALE